MHYTNKDTSARTAPRGPHLLALSIFCSHLIPGLETRNSRHYKQNPDVTTLSIRIILRVDTSTPQQAEYRLDDTLPMPSTWLIRIILRSKRVAPKQGVHSLRVLAYTLSGNAVGSRFQERSSAPCSFLSTDINVDTSKLAGGVSHVTMFLAPSPTVCHLC